MRIILVTTLLLLTGCARALLDSPIEVSLTPIHSITTGLADSSEHALVNLLDNDGNMYLSKWNLNELSEDEFGSIVNACRNQIEPKKHFKGLISISDIDIEKIQPSLYKEFTQCVAFSNQSFISATGYRPERYKLSIYRGHSKRGTYMPVGGTFYLEKKDSEFKEIFEITAACHERALANEQNGISEFHATGYSYVSIESYVKELNLCLLKASVRVFELK